MNFDDPKITAYALGELDSAEDRAAVESLLREHPELSAELEETRAVAQFLRRELKAEDGEVLTAAQRKEVLAAAHLGNSTEAETVAASPRAENIVTEFPWWRRHWVPSAVAATVILSTSIASLWNMQRPRFVQISATKPLGADEKPPMLATAPSENAVTPAPTAKSDTGSPVPSQKPSADLPTVKRYFSEAQDFKDTGRYDLAYKRAEQILNIDPNNIVARKLQEEVNQKREEYAAQGYNHTRSYTTWQVDKAWDRPVRKFATRDAGATSAPAAPSALASNSGEVRLDAVPAPKLSEREKLELSEVTAGRATNPPVPGKPAVVSSTSLGVNLAQNSPVLYDARPAARAAAPVNDALGRSLPYYRGRGIEEPSPRLPELEQVIELQRAPEVTQGQAVGHLYKSVDELQFRQISPEQARGYRFQTEPSNTESYDNVTDNAFLTVRDNPLSTFSIDVDTASYSNVRRFLTNNQRPPKGSVRIEELVNYFPYTYPQPQGEDPFSCTMEVAACPWTPQHRLVRVALKGREIAKEKLPPTNLVFLFDVSGSMQPANKLPLVKECMQQLVAGLREQDTVGIVVYAGSSGTVLEPTSDKAAIRSALDRLEAGGSTNGASGIQGAYDLAQRAFKKEGNNRVILCTDGDFNVGVTNQSDLVDLIQRRAKGGVFLSVLGFGMGNTKDSTMEKLADKGNGNYAYIDSLKEGRKVLVEQMAGTLFTIAKDVKIQVEFNPAKVGAYRLIGYENRLLAKEDFNDDTKDAGEIGAGHSVTALYEVVPAGTPLPATSTVDPLKYQQPPAQPEPAQKSEIENQKSRIASDLLTLKLRFKQPDGDKSVLREFPLTDSGASWEKSSTDFRWAAAVASFGMLLRDSPHRGNATWESVTELANEGKGTDAGGYRTEFIQLIDRAKQLVPVTPLASLTKGSKDDTAAQGKAASLVIPEFDLNDTPLLDAIDALVKKSRELDPEKKGVSIVFSGGNNAAQLKANLRMRNTTVLETAKAIASTVGLTLQEQGEILILKAGQQ
ncbi:YfbK domain-containing protein [Verrucomicrobiota bacterium sgz303538]